MGLAGQPGIPPTAAPPEASYRRPEDIIVLSRSHRIPCTTSHKACHKLYDKRHPILGCLLMRDPWVWPDNPAYPPWPHLRYPLTSKDEDPNKKILARQSCSRERRTLLFYLTRTAYHALPHTKHANNSPTTRDTPILGCLLTRDPWVLPAKPDIPPMAAPPEASYRRPEDNIVLSHSHRIPCTTSHKTHRQTLQ